MSDELEVLRQRLDALRGQNNQLGRQLIDAGTAMCDSDLVLSDAVVQEIADRLSQCRHDFDALVEDTISLATLIENLDSLTRQIKGFDSLVSLVQRISQHRQQEAMRNESLAVLDRVGCLAHCLQDDFPPLQECQAHAVQLRQAIVAAELSNLPDAVQALVSGEHPYAQLLTLVGSWQEIDEFALVKLQDAVTGIGQDGRYLAAAASHGRLKERSLQDKSPLLDASSDTKLDATSLKPSNDRSDKAIVDEPEELVDAIGERNHALILRQGIDVWNRWRASKPDIRPDLSNRNFQRDDLAGANLTNVDFTDSDLEAASLEHANLTGAIMRDANLSRVCLVGASLKGTMLLRAILRAADLSHTDLRQVDLVGADLTQANLSFSDLRGLNLNEAHLPGASFQGANLTGAHLRDANLCGASFLDAILVHADLTHADLSGTNWQGAILADAVFQDADLYHADFSNAISVPLDVRLGEQ